MTLADLGYQQPLETIRRERGLAAFEVGRVSAAHKDSYGVTTAQGAMAAELLGNLRYVAQNRADLPVVGDWVAITPYDTNKVLIQAIFPRQTVIIRQAVGQFAEQQPLAANIDVALIVQAVDRDFNLNRLERYLTLCHAARVHPVIILNKIDLIGAERLKAIQIEVAARIPRVSVISISNQIRQGYAELKARIVKGKTYCLLGSSGVGKSTLLNNLAGRQLMATDEISQSTGKGKHVTSRRALFVLPTGGVFIDNPGLRAVGIADPEAGLRQTFESIPTLARQCKFRDCTHQHEPGCAVLAALKKGSLDRAAYQNYLKMEREAAHFKASRAERRQKDRAFGKMVQRFKKDRGDKLK